MAKVLSANFILMLVVIMLAVAVINEFARHQPQKESGAAAMQYATVTLFTQTAKPLLIKAEVAATEEQITTGLMFRKSLGKDQGMLFVFPNVNVQHFWMKNTLIPLDMVFIAENMTIIKIHHAIPCSSDPCQLYNSEQPIKYVLEVNGNFTIYHAIKEGGRVEIAI